MLGTLQSKAEDRLPHTASMTFPNPREKGPMRPEDVNHFGPPRTRQPLAQQQSHGYHRNAPAYLNYHADPLRMQCYLAEDEGHRIDDLFGGPSAEGAGAAFHRFEFPLSDCRQVFLFSDGVSSCMEAPTAEILEHLMAIRSCKGRFVLRRSRRFLRRTCPQLGWSHRDDLAVAAIHTGAAA